MKSVQNYELLDTLGEGAFGTVRKARKDGQFYAIKFMLDGGMYTRETVAAIFEKEARLLSELDHPNVLKLIEVVRDAQSGVFGGTGEAGEAGKVSQQTDPSSMEAEE